MSEQVRIIEKKKVPSGATLLFGFPDVGLVGVIAASHLIEELGLTEVAYMDSELVHILRCQTESLFLEHHVVYNIFSLISCSQKKSHLMHL